MYFINRPMFCWRSNNRSTSLATCIYTSSKILQPRLERSKNHKRKQATECEMVLKKSKYKVNSGNTLHFGQRKCEHSRLNRGQNVIIKKFPQRLRHVANAEAANEQILKEAASFIDDGGLEHEHIVNRIWEDLSAQDIVYSLNKRKRWLIPQQIKNCVKHQAISDTATDFKITMAERKMLALVNNYTYGRALPFLGNDCTAYYDTSWEEGKVIPKKGFSYETDLKKKGRAKDNKKKGKSSEKKEFIYLANNHKFRGIQRQCQFGRNRRFCNEEPEERGEIPDWLLRAHPPGRNDGESDEALPRVHYEVCTTRPLTAHQAFCGDNEIAKVYAKRGWHRYLFKNPNGTKKSLKKVKGLSKRQKPNTGIGDLSKLAQQWNQCADIDTSEGFNNWDDSCDFNDSDCEEHIIDRRDLPKAHFGDVVDSICTPLIEDVCLDDSNKTDINNNNKCLHGKHISPNTATSQTIYVHPRKELKPNLDDFLHRTELNRGVENEEEQAPSVTETLQVPQLPTPFTCTVPSSDLDPQILQLKYGSRYMEGKSLPRAFSIISADTEEPHPDVTPEAVLFRISETQDNQWLKTGHVRLKTTFHGGLGISRFNETSLPLKNSMSFMGTASHLEEVIGHVMQSLKAAPSDRPEQSQPKKYYTKAVIKKFDSLAKICGWQTEVYTLHQASRIAVDTSEHKTNRNLLRTLARSLSDTTESNDILREMTEYCDICFAFIGNEEGSSVNGMALKECQHWFCLECWHHHITARIRQGDAIITCPGHECKTHIDDVTLRSLTTYSQYVRLVQRRHEKQVEANEQLKWCPNAKCGRVVHAFFKDPADAKCGPCVDCLCGHTWCFSCQNEAHWPTTCDQAQTYKKMLKQNGDDIFQEQHTYFAQVKKCPRCNYPFEKNGGCQHMSCRCGFQFCWECLAAWNLHGYNNGSNFCPQGRKGLTTVELDSSKDLALPVLYYKYSVEHRQARQRWSWPKVNRQVSGLVHRVKFGRSHGYLGATQKTASNSCAFPLGCEVEHAIISDVANFAFQSHFLLEYACVVLSNATRSIRSTKTATHVTHLDFIITHIMQVIAGEVRLPPGDVVPCLQQLQQQGNSCIHAIVSGSRRMQRRLHSSKLGPLDARVPAFSGSAQV